MEIISSDGRRKVVLTVLDKTHSKYEFFEDVNCVMEFTYVDTVSNVSNISVNKGLYIGYVNKFLDSGFDNEIVKDIFKLCSHRLPEISLNLSEFLQIQVTRCPLVTINIMGKYVLSTSIAYNHICYSIEELRQMSINELLRLSGSWSVVDIINSLNRDVAGNPLQCFEFNNITFLGYQQVLEIFNNYKYIGRVDYLNTGSIFKKNAFTNNDERFFIKAAAFKKKILILYIEDDLSIIHRLVD